MRNDIGEINYRKLLYYFTNGIWVHFKDNNGIFYNGEIIDLNEEKLTLVLKERVQGETPFLLEDINPNSIRTFKLGDERE